MLYLALLLILAALGFLIAAFVLGTAWAWPSIALSGLAAVTLVLDWLLRRRAAKKAAKAAAEDEDGDADDEDEAVAATSSSKSEDADGDIPEKAIPTADPEETVIGAGAYVGKHAKVSDAEKTTTIDPVSDDEDDDLDEDPGEEETDAADLLIVHELGDEVLVVDEHPRYHLRQCGWLAARDTIPIPVSEARELGFTPCAQCGPDATLAAKKRRKSKKNAGGLFSKK